MDSRPRPLRLEKYQPRSSAVLAGFRRIVDDSTNELLELGQKHVPDGYEWQSFNQQIANIWDAAHAICSYYEDLANELGR